ncbi:MAG: hypothetical protein K2J90_11635, partial [Lachnospiraceae bacterium]|nr:hypothetical protein [Lachnospiraceae bacterium]
MVILEAEIELQNIYNSAQSFQNAHIRLAISFDGHTVHESMISSKNGSDICFERGQKVIITIPTGECSLNYIEENKRIDLYCGKKIGYGFVKHIREVYIEYENLKLLN